MHWLLMRTRRTLALLGYEYPPSYLLIAWAGYALTVVTAAADRIVRGLDGNQWLGVVAATCAGLAPLTGVCHTRRIWKPMLTVMTAVTVGLFWIVPVQADAAALLLVISVTMSSAVARPSENIFDVVALLSVLGAGVAIDRVEQGWLIAAMICFGVAVGRLLQAQLLLLRRERQARASQAVLDRAGMAREIHDVVAHSLSIVLLNVTGARRALQQDADTEEALAALKDAEAQGRTAMTDVRRTIELLRTEGESEFAQPGVDDLPALVDTFQRAGTSVAYNALPLPQELSSATELAIYRIAQESLSNASRHAPGAPIEVTIAPAHAGVLVVVLNDISEDTRRRAGGSGLSGMRSRAELLGGYLTVGRHSNQWRVEAFIPVPESCPDDGYGDVMTKRDNTHAATDG
ncbi:putative two-component histidine kinase [Gordonia effusa NBRC 100432]|uniref:histidine kinase n=1 Tax=Gordonia effusa NBRC 100432 TaxID=1077974 RepID=H0QZ64_9ACTN|nr:histidine kinase [Gordonia effusa]GAB18115.1 putative two-component histidine kinase [Gordonia effusa NBRC 100432]